MFERQTDSLVWLRRNLFWALLAFILLNPVQAEASGQSTVTDVGTRNIIKLIADPVRPLVYGLNQAPLGAGQNSSVVAFNAATGEIMQEATLGPTPSDVALSARSDALYVIHMNNRISRIHLPSFAVDLTRDLSTLPNYSDWTQYDIAAGRPGIVYFTDAAWAPTVYTYDFALGQELGRYNPGEEGVGDLAVSKDGNTLYTWRQYGWTAGIISTYLRRADSSGVNPIAQETSEIYGEREPFDTPILLDSAEQRIFYKTRVHAAADLRRVLTTFPEHIYAITEHGELAFGTSKVYNGLTGAQVGTMPFPTVITAVSGDQKRLFVYSTSTRKLVTSPLSQYGEVSGPGLIPNPRNGEAVSAGLDELSWSSSPVAFRYEVYLGTSSNEVATAGTNSSSFLGRVAETSIDAPPAIRQQGVFYWRVDIASIAGTTRGAVWQFQVAPIVVVPRKVTLSAIAGSSPLPVSINVWTNGTESAWSVAESIPWATASPQAGAGNGVVSVTLDLAGLNTGTYTNQLNFTSGNYTFMVPVELQVLPLDIIKMAADLERPYIYALQKSSGGTSQCYLLFIHSETGRIEKTIPLGSNLMDLDISYAEARLYVADWGHDITHVIDLDSQAPLEALHLGTDVLKINAGRPGRIFTEGWDQWINLTSHDSLTGTQVNRVFVREGDGEADPTGEYYYHCDNNISNAHIQKYRVSDDGFTQVKTSLQHPYGSRNLLLSGDGSRLFWRGFIYDADLNELGSLNEEIYGTTLRGELAFSESKVFNSANGRVLTNLPFSSTVMAVAGNQEKLFAYNPVAKRLEVLRLAEIAPVQGIDLIPTPAHGQVVSLPVSQLSWSVSPFALRYHVFMGTNENEVATATEVSAQFLGTTLLTSLPLTNALAPGRTYFWRVDSVGFSGTRKGATWNFVVAPVAISPAVLNIQAVAGAPAPTRSLDLRGAGASWTVFEDSPWFAVTPGSGTGDETLTFSVVGTNLAPGLYTNKFSLISGGVTLEVPVTLQVFKMALTKMLADLERPYIYALHPGSGTFDDAFLIIISTLSGQIENVLPIGTNPTDFSINYFEDRLYVSNLQRNRTRVVDLVRQVELPSLQLGVDVYKINAGRAGRIFIEQTDQWIEMNIVDSLTGTIVARGSVREGDGEGDPTGTYYYHCDNNSSGATLQKYRVSNDSFELVASGPNHGFGSRNLVMSGDGSRLFWQGYIYNEDLQELGGLGEEIYATTRDGQFAFSSTKIYDTVSRQVNFSLPFTTTVMAVAGSQDKAFLYHPDGSVRILEMREVTNRPPTAESFVVHVDEDTSVTITPIATDPDSDQMTFSVFSPPPSGNLQSQGNGWTFLPATNFTGAVSFTYVASDGYRNSAQAIVTINVRPINDAPAIGTNRTIVLKDTPRALRLNAEDPDGDLLTFEILSQPQHGAIDRSTFLYTPGSGYTGPDEFDFEVTDGKSAPVRGSARLVIQEAACIPAARGLVNWWPGENSSDDVWGDDPLLATTAPAFADGMVGRGFLLSAENPELQAPESYRLNSDAGFTVEAWIKPMDTFQRSKRIFYWEHAGPMLYVQDGRIAFSAQINASEAITVTAPHLVMTNVFQHVALTFDKPLGTFRVFLDGRAVLGHTQTNLPPQATGHIRFGGPADPFSGATGMFGVLDEPTVYARPLGAAEIEDIFLAAAQGKCPPQIPPSFADSPSHREVFQGSKLEISGVARGSAPISYQWTLNGEVLPGQTHSTLTITNIAPAQAGVYAVGASNAFGTAGSSGIYVSVRAAGLLQNGGFETANIAGWTVNDISFPYSPVRVRPAGYRPSALFFTNAPTEGRFALVHGFDGIGPGTIRVAQDISVPLGRPALTFDYRAAWNLRNAIYDRTISVVIEPPGGGLPLDFVTFVRATAGTFNSDTGPKSSSIDLTPYAGRSVRISFDAEVPEAGRGPGFFELDNVALISSEAPVIVSQPRHIAAVEQVPLTLRVEARGAAPLSYQWRRDGEVLSGGNVRDLALAALKEQAGTYTLTISNAFGTTVSAPIRVEISEGMQVGTPYQQNGVIWLPVGALPAQSYIVQTSSDLQTWIDVGPPMLIENSWTSFAVPNEPLKFYRLRDATVTQSSGSTSRPPITSGGVVVVEGAPVIQAP